MLTLFACELGSFLRPFEIQKARWGGCCVGRFPFCRVASPEGARIERSYEPSSRRFRAARPRRALLSEHPPPPARAPPLRADVGRREPQPPAVHRPQPHLPRPAVPPAEARASTVMLGFPSCASVLGGEGRGGEGGWGGRHALCPPDPPDHTFQLQSPCKRYTASTRWTCRANTRWTLCPPSSRCAPSAVSCFRSCFTPPPSPSLFFGLPRLRAPQLRKRLAPGRGLRSRAGEARNIAS